MLDLQCNFEGHIEERLRTVVQYADETTIAMKKQPDNEILDNSFSVRTAEAIAVSAHFKKLFENVTRETAPHLNKWWSDAWSKEMITFLWVKSLVSYLDRRHTLASLHKELNARPIRVPGFSARAVLEITHDERPWNKAQAIFLGAILETTSLSKDTYKDPVVDQWQKNIGERSLRRQL